MNKATHRALSEEFMQRRFDAHYKTSMIEPTSSPLDNEAIGIAYRGDVTTDVLRDMAKRLADHARLRGYVPPFKITIKRHPKDERVTQFFAICPRNTKEARRDRENKDRISGEIRGRVEEFIKTHSVEKRGA